MACSLPIYLYFCFLSGASFRIFSMDLVESCAVEIDIVISRAIMYALGQIVVFLHRED